MLTLGFPSLTYCIKIEIWVLKERCNVNATWYLLVQIQQWWHQNNMWNLFKVKNKDTGTRSMMSFHLLRNVPENLRKANGFPGIWGNTSGGKTNDLSVLSSWLAKFKSSHKVCDRKNLQKQCLLVFFSLFKLGMWHATLTKPYTEAWETIFFNRMSRFRDCYAM